MISQNEDNVSGISNDTSQENYSYFNEEAFEYFNDFELNEYRNIIWKRPKEIIDDPCLLESYDKDIDGYLISGSNTPRWFPVIVTLLKTKNLLNLVCKDITKQDNFNQSSYIGMFEFHFFGCNKWNRIFIDDKLPFIVNVDETSNVNLFCLASNKEEFFPSLLEKAYAKYVGGYGKLKNINFINGLMNLTGGIIEKMELKRDLLPSIYQDQRTFFKMLKSLDEDTFVMCNTASSKQKTDLENGDKSNNALLPSNHYYLLTGLTSIPSQPNKSIIGTMLTSVLDSKNQEYTYMLKLHNPLLSGDWTGSFSIGSLEWDAVNEKVRRHYNLKFDHECEFWISMDDFMMNMVNMTFCQVPTQSYFDIFKNSILRHNTSQNGSYSSVLSGGSLMSLANEFLKNDQYVMNVMGPTVVDVKVVLSMNCINKTIRFDDGCGLVLLKVENNREFRLHDLSNSESVNVKTLSETGNSFSISTSLSRGKYILLPWRKSVAEVEYYIRLYSNQKSITLSLLKEDKPSFVQCLTCSLVSTLKKTKDVIVGISHTDSKSDKLGKREKCLSCHAVNPEIALRMTVVSAIGLERNDDKSNKNSYFILRSPNYCYKSNTKFSTNNPCWNENFIFYRTRDQQNDISVEVFADQRIGFDKNLGIHVFTEAEFTKDEVIGLLKIPVNKEWVNTSSKVLVKFKSYSPDKFDMI